MNGYKSLSIATNSTIELNGNRMFVKTCLVNGVRLVPNTYRATDPLVANSVDDASVGTSGELVVMGDYTMVIIR